ncbi:transcriptional regulator BetI [Burkholderia stabilis]|uniref:transcriptional regulator BetI n=1 Tax=Burkholderia stabilis TaxID=95485 RepID=UPI000A838945|nr:transcriptional regulator BetI [Burkholderia stabilis]
MNEGGLRAETMTTSVRMRSRETPDVRKKALIQATMRSIAKYGFHGTTVETICAEAKLSRGMVNHHFKSKDELLRQSYQELCDEWAARTYSASQTPDQDPVERLRTLIHVSFDAQALQSSYIGIWVAYWGAIGKSNTLKAVHNRVRAREIEAYEALFRAVEGSSGKALNARRAAISLLGVIDGLWLEWGLDPKAFSTEEAKRACLDILEALVRS